MRKLALCISQNFSKYKMLNSFFKMYNGKANTLKVSTFNFGILFSKYIFKILFFFFSFSQNVG